MILSEITSPGDKIDIRLMHQVKIEDNGGEMAQVYKSVICDYLSDDLVEIGMPTADGRMVLFQVNAECQMVIYTKRGMYQCTAVVQKRYKKDNLYLLSMEIATEPKRFQRREFFRVDLLTEVQYYVITKEIAALPTTEELFLEIEKPEYIDCMKCGMVKDISGGGMLFSSEEQLQTGSYILLNFRLSSERIDESFYLVSQCVGSYRNTKTENLYDHRMKFIFKNLRDREKIVRFVFEEERRIRKKEVGES